MSGLFYNPFSLFSFMGKIGLNPKLPNKEKGENMEKTKTCINCLNHRSCLVEKKYTVINNCENFLYW